MQLSWCYSKMPLPNPTITSKSPGKAREAEHSRDEGAVPFNRMTMQGQVIRDHRRRGKQPNVLEDQKQLISSEHHTAEGR